MAVDPVARPVSQPEGSPTAFLAPVRQNYKELVALVAANKEGPLHAQLYSNVHPVRFEIGQLEIRVGSNAPPDLASRLTKFLTVTTGQRWMVSLSSAEGEPTLAELDKAAEKKRHERALQHPLMQAVVKTFPNAKMTALRQKAVVPVVVDTPVLGDADEVMPVIEADD